MDIGRTRDCEGRTYWDGDFYFCTLSSQWHKADSSALSGIGIRAVSADREREIFFDIGRGTEKGMRERR